jgi:hypothetical protein
MVTPIESIYNILQIKQLYLKQKSIYPEQILKMIYMASLQSKRYTLRILLDSGDYKDIKFAEFPAVYSWGRKDSVPVTYILNGMTYRGKKKYKGIKIRKEGIPGDPYDTLGAEEIDQIMIDMEAEMKKENIEPQNIKFKIQALYSSIHKVVMNEAGKIITTFDADHSKSETLRANKSNEFNWTIMIAAGFAGIVGYIIGNAIPIH